MHIQSAFVVGASSDMGQPFRPRQKNLGLGWGKSRLSHYDIRAEGALPYSITVWCDAAFSNTMHIMEGRKEGNALFNDALNTFYLRLYGVRHMVKDHSDSEKGNPLSPHRLLFPISSKSSFICTIPQTG